MLKLMHKLEISRTKVEVHLIQFNLRAAEMRGKNSMLGRFDHSLIYWLRLGRSGSRQDIRRFMLQTNLLTTSSTLKQKG